MTASPTSGSPAIQFGVFELEPRAGCYTSRLFFACPLIAQLRKASLHELTHFRSEPKPVRASESSAAYVFPTTSQLNFAWKMLTRSLFILISAGENDL